MNGSLPGEGGGGGGQGEWGGGGVVSIPECPEKSLGTYTWTLPPPPPPPHTHTQKQPPIPRHTITSQFFPNHPLHPADTYGPVLIHNTCKYSPNDCTDSSQEMHEGSATKKGFLYTVGKNGYTVHKYKYAWAASHKSQVKHKGRKERWWQTWRLSE